jgi:hypothetical protein
MAKIEFSQHKFASFVNHFVFYFFSIRVSHFFISYIYINSNPVLRVLCIIYWFLLFFSLGTATLLFSYCYYFSAPLE